MKKLISIVTLLAMLLSVVSFAAPVADQAVEGIDEYQEVVTETTTQDASLAADVVTDLAAANYGELVYEQDFEDEENLPAKGYNTGAAPAGYQELSGKLAGNYIAFQTNGAASQNTIEFVEDGENNTAMLFTTTATAQWGGGLHIGFFNTNEGITYFNDTTNGGNQCLQIDLDNAVLTMVFDIKYNADNATTMYSNWNSGTSAAGTATAKSHGALAVDKTQYVTYAQAYAPATSTSGVRLATRFGFACQNATSFYLDNIKVYYKEITSEVEATRDQIKNYGELVFSNNFDVAAKVKTTTHNDASIANMMPLTGALEGYYLKVSNGTQVSTAGTLKLDNGALSMTTTAQHQGIVFTICDANGNFTGLDLDKDMLTFVADIENTSGTNVVVEYNVNVSKQNTNMGTISGSQKNVATRVVPGYHNTFTSAQGSLKTTAENKNSQFYTNKGSTSVMYCTSAAATFRLDNLRIFYDKAEGTWNNPEDFTINPETGKFANAAGIRQEGTSKFDVQHAEVIEDGNSIGKITITQKDTNTDDKADYIAIPLALNDAVQVSQIERIQIRYKYDTPYFYNTRSDGYHTFTKNSAIDVWKMNAEKTAATAEVSNEHPRYYSKPAGTGLANGEMGLSDGTTVQLSAPQFDRYACEWKTVDIMVSETASTGYFQGENYILLPLTTEEALYIDYIKFVLRPSAKAVSDYDASINVDTADTNNKTGIRFLSTIFSDIVNSATTTQYGFIATLKTKLDDAGITPFEFTLKNNDFPAKDGNTTNYIVGYAYDVDAGTNITYALDETTGDKTISGVFYGIPAGSYDAEIVLRPFVATNPGGRTLQSGEKFLTYSYGAPMVGSVQELATMLKANTSAYNKLSADQQAIVEALIANVAA